MKATRLTASSVFMAGILGSCTSERFNEDQEVFRNLKKVCSGPVVSSKSSVNVDFKMSSSMW